MQRRLKNITVYSDEKLRNVLLKINRNGNNGVFVISKKNELIGVITDADLRKNLLKNKLNLNNYAISIAQKKYLKIPFSKVEESKEILIKSNKILLPIVKGNKLIDFIHTKDLFNENKINRRKILVIGGFGYIGSVLVNDLLKQKYLVNILDDNYYGCYLGKNLKNNKDLKIFYGDCDNKEILNKALAGCTDVIHLGEIVGDPAVNLNENFSIKNNYENTVFVISECIKNNINKFIFASSCSVYGDSPTECNEKSNLNPVSLYAKCKIECEKSILLFKSKKFCPVILRLSTVYGDSPRKRFDLVVNRFVIMAVKKLKISLFGASSWRPFISVNDVSRVLIKTLNTKNSLVRNQIFNVGGNKENYRISDIVKIISKYSPINFEYTKKDEDKRNYKVSFKKINKILNFKPEDNLKKVIFRLLKKYKKLKINEKNVNYYNDKKMIKILDEKK
jgi:nucleoside-diphosphate-sugar epimerase